MQIREATKRDIPAILNVLKASLGEVSSRKTREVWEFKHIINPFGQSLVLVAEEADEIIGVRAFMRWEWQLDGRIFKCFRAVDTATHPDHQGKGIFKKLTLKAIDLGKKEGKNFVFNTPNVQSLPGYLKMGWEKVGRLEVKLYPTSPFCWFSNYSGRYKQRIYGSEEDLDELCFFKMHEKKKQGIYFTPKSVRYLRWRYEENPLQAYEIVAEKDIYLAAYIKEHKYLRELRVAEMLLSENVNLQQVFKIINKWAKKFGAHFISVARDRNFNQFKISGSYGPLLTVRRLDILESDYKDILVLDNFDYSLGDLELF